MKHRARKARRSRRRVYNRFHGCDHRWSAMTLLCEKCKVCRMELKSADRRVAIWNAGQRYAAFQTQRRAGLRGMGLMTIWTHEKRYFRPFDQSRHHTKVGGVWGKVGREWRRLFPDPAKEPAVNPGSDREKVDAGEFMDGLLVKFCESAGLRI